MKKISVLLLILGILAVFICGGSLDAAEDPVLSAGFLKFVEDLNAPGFRMENMEGGRVMLEDFKGKIVLLFFWTTW